MRKLFSFLLATLILLNLVTALNMSANYSSDVIVRGVENSIEMTLNVTEAETGIYNLYTLADVTISPSETFEMHNETFEKTFEIRPREALDVEGNYAFTYTLNHRGVEKYNKKAIINFVNLDDAIIIGSDSIDPESGKISFYVENLESAHLKNLTAKFSSIFFDIEKTFDLKPNERLEISASVDEELLKKTKAGVYIIESVFETSFGDVEVNGNLYLGEKKGVASTEDKSGLLVRTQTITKVNMGNVVESIEVELDYNIFSRLFTTFNIEPAMIQRDGFVVTYTWSKDRLNPTESYVIKAKTNYILPFFIILFATLALLGLKRFSETKLEIKKSVSHVRTKNGEFALRIRLAVKAKKNIENVTLTDRVPAMVKIYNKFGATKPDKIDAHTRRLHWHIGDLKSGEVRLFNYVVYSKVGIVGKFVLPSAKAVFEKDEKISEITSNKVFFMSDQVTN